MHLPFYLEKLLDRLGKVEIVICLDSAVLEPDAFYHTTSLRGGVDINLNVSVLSEGVHSGHGSGIVPSSFRILRALLDRIENSETGEMINDF